MARGRPTEPPDVNYEPPVYVCDECGARRQYPGELHAADCSQTPRATPDGEGVVYRYDGGETIWRPDEPN